MREVRNVAQTIRDTMKALKAQAAASVAELQSEVANAETNMKKVAAMTKELKEANHEVEAVLGEAGSNFPTSELPPVQYDPPKPVNSQGVTIGEGKSPKGPAYEGVTVNKDA